MELHDLAVEMSMFAQHLEICETDMRELHKELPAHLQDSDQARAVVRAFHLVRQAQLALLSSEDASHG
jgi:hypothetical protein